MYRLRKLCRPLALTATILTLWLSCCFAQKPGDPPKANGDPQSNTAQFEAFFSKFKEAVRANNVDAIADSLNFPFYVYSSSYSRTEFVHDKNEKVNFFTPYVRAQIAKSSMDDFVTYQNKKELGDTDPGYSLIPDDSPLFELDIINNHGGSAMRLMFARIDSSYKLFCLTQ